MKESDPTEAIDFGFSYLQNPELKQFKVLIG